MSGVAPSSRIQAAPPLGIGRTTQRPTYLSAARRSWALCDVSGWPRRGGGEDPWLCGPGFGRVCPCRGVHPTVGAGTRTVKQVLASSQRGHGRRHILGPTKTSQNRAVPIGDRAMRTLHRHRVTLAKWKLLMGRAVSGSGIDLRHGDGQHHPSVEPSAPCLPAVAERGRAAGYPVVRPAA